MPERDGSSKPRFPIRRFDVFAEYNRVKNVAAGMSEPIARGRGLWIAKVIAGRGAGSVPNAGSASKGDHAGRHAEDPPAADRDDDFRSVGGVPQTDAMFDKEIVDRMGKDFYQQTFQPAIEAAFMEGKQYTEIRDVIRRNWKGALNV